MEKALNRASVIVSTYATPNAARERSATSRGKKKPPGVLSLVVWLGVVTAVVWELEALCALYPDAAIFSWLGFPFGLGAPLR